MSINLQNDFCLLTEYLKHAPCLQVVESKTQVCEDKLDSSIRNILNSGTTGHISERICG